MDILIGEKHKITSDTFNVIVSEKYEKKDEEGNPSGKFDFKQIAFCATLEFALLLILERNPKANDVKSLNELVQLIRSSKEEIIKAVSELKGS